MTLREMSEECANPTLYRILVIVVPVIVLGLYVGLQLQTP